MQQSRRPRPAVLVVVGLFFVLVLTLVYAWERGKKEYAFRGTVERVDALAGTLDVNNEDVEGHYRTLYEVHLVPAPSR